MQNFEEFKSELIEEQLEQLWYVTGEQSTEARMVQDLAAFYARDASMLEQVWLRLESAQASPAAPQLLSLEERRQKKDTLMDIEKEHDSLQRQTMYATKSPKKPFFRVFTTLAAALVGVIIVGSLLFAFGAMKQHATKTSVHNLRQNVAVQQVTPLPTPPHVGNAAGLYVVSNGLYRLDPVTGKELWFHNIGALTDPNAKGGPAFLEYVFATGDGMVFVGENDGTGSLNKFYGLDASTGQTLWTLPLDLESLRFANGTLYADMDNAMEAINPRTGTTIWTSSSLGGFFDIAGITEQAIYCVASVDGGAKGAAQIWALRTDNGKQIWTKPVDGLQVAFKGMSYANGVLYVAGSAGQPGTNLATAPNYIMAYSATDGNKLWRSVPLTGLISAPAVAHGLVYSGTSLNHLYALDARTGHIKWQKQPGGDASGPAYVTGNTLIVAALTSHTDYGATSQIMAYDATTGAFKWSQNAPGLLASDAASLYANGATQLIVSGNTIYYHSDTVHMLDVATGNPLPDANVHFPDGPQPSMMIWSQES